jgi:hypothetical protein
MPDEFVYPAQDDFDACRMFSNKDTVLNECSLETGRKNENNSRSKRL